MKTTFRTLAKMHEEILKDDNLLSAIVANPKQFFENLEFTKSPINIPWVFVIVVLVLGIALVLCLVYISQIASAGPVVIGEQTQLREVPEIFGVIASAAIAAIAGLLVPSPLNKRVE